jgi:oligopeptide transport system ATP-binding protein
VTTLVDVRDLVKHFAVATGFLDTGEAAIKAVDGVTFHIEKGTTMGLVGESGCGKTTVGKNLLLLQRPTAGSICIDGQGLLSLDTGALRAMRRRLGIVYQNPHSSLNPRSTVNDIVGRPLVLQGVTDRRERAQRTAAILERVGLSSQHMGRYPHEFSGGQKQRIAIARALITSPEFVVLDEPTSALDVSVQAQILRLLRDLQHELNLTYLFISHDISVIRFMSDMVAVMYVGKIVEWATRVQLFQRPLHPYTQALWLVVPIPDPRLRGRERTLLPGDVPSPRNPPSGCRFHARCERALPECRAAEPPLVQVEPSHYVACHLYEAG